MKKRVLALVLSVLLCLSLLPAVAFAADGDATVDITSSSSGNIVVSEASAKPGDTVDITVSLEKNPGIINLKLNVAYDSNVLTLTGRTDANIFGTAYHAPINQSNPAANPYILSWANDLVTSNLTVNGLLVTLTFKVSESAAPGKYDITATYGTYYIYDVDIEPVDFTVVHGAVTVQADAPVNHTVTFNSNGGTGTMSPQTASVTTALTANSFTRTGYTFAGWNTAANGSGTPYANGATYSFAADATLYAQWAAYGDVNGDGEVTDADRIKLARYLAGWSGYEISESVSDVNGDGEVTYIDRTILTRHLAGWIGYETLPHIA